MPGPIASEVIAALTDPPKPIPVLPTKPVPTYPSAAPPGSPVPTPQPTYQVADPNSRWGMSPRLASMAQFGAVGFVVLVCWTLLSNVIDSKKSGQAASDDAQKALLTAFQEDRKQHNIDVRDLTQGILKTQSDLQGEIRANGDVMKNLIRAIEKLESRIEGKKLNPAGVPDNPGG